VTEIIDWIMESIRAYGPWSVFAGVMIESVIVPIPSRLGFVIVAGAAGFGAFAYWQASKSHTGGRVPVSV